MAAKMISMSSLKQILMLLKNGTPLKETARQVGVSKNTVKKYRSAIQSKGLSYEGLLSMEDHQAEGVLCSPFQHRADTRYQALEVLLPHFGKELARTGVSKFVLWTEYRSQHPEGYSYPQFCRYLLKWQKTQAAVMHFSHSPGDKLYIDYTGKKLSYVDRHTGEVSYVEVYVATLGYSQYTYVEATISQKKHDFIASTQNALQYFGGSPKALVPDNLKSAVTRACKYEPSINESFQSLANHYNTVVLPARPYKPRDKAIVENTVKVVYSHIFAPLRDRVFHSLHALNQAIGQELEKLNAKTFRTQGQSRTALFKAEEKQTLLPLPAKGFELKSYKEVTVMKNSHVSLGADKHYYSVPHRFIGKKVKLAYSQSQVEVFYRQERIAFHVRDMKRFGYTSLKSHLPSSHQFVSDWKPEKFLSWARGISPVVEAYITRVLESKPYPEQAYKSCVGILSLGKKAGKERLIAACARAAHFNAYNYKVVASILENNLENQQYQPDTGQLKIPSHENIRGPKDYR